MGRFSDWGEKTKTLFNRPKTEGQESPYFLKSFDRLRIPLLFLMGFALSALVVEVVFQYIVPPSRKPRFDMATKKLYFLQPRSSYDTITQKNVFCPGCPIPDLESRKVERPKDCDKADRLAGSIKLIGTIVLSSAKYSVATMASGGPAKSYRVGDQVESYGSVFEIRRDRVCVLKSDDRLVYVELAGVPRTTGGGGATATRPTAVEGIAQASDTDFEIKRDFLMKTLSDMSVLQTAYATPYFEDNEIKGFRIQSIDPGSPLLALGLKPNDIITKADNQPINNIAKAQEILAGASTLDSLVITVQRGGQDVNLNYKVGK